MSLFMNKQEFDQFGTITKGELQGNRIDDN